LEAFKAIEGPPMTFFFRQFFLGPLEKKLSQKEF
jgi:hypothetical protein